MIVQVSVWYGLLSWYTLMLLRSILLLVIISAL